MAAEDVETNGDDNELDEEESVLSQDSQYKRVANSGSKKDSDDFEKREKNVKRRVYDALNVLYAAGVLKKEGKYVSCNSDEIDTFPPPLSDKNKQRGGGTVDVRSQCLATTGWLYNTTKHLI